MHRSPRRRGFLSLSDLGGGLLFVVTSGRAVGTTGSSHRRRRRRRRGSSAASMLRAGRMEEFVTEEEEPWYDQRDLEQGEPTPPNPTPFLLATAGPPGVHAFRGGWKTGRRLHLLKATHARVGAACPSSHQLLRSCQRWFGQQSSCQTD